MSNYLQKVIYLSEEQYQNEITNGTLNSSYLYVTDNHVTLTDLGDTILDVPHGGTGLTTIPVNSILVGNGTNAMTTKASANGVLYATAANGALQWGTLPPEQGGTGKTSLNAAANAFINSLGTGDSLLTANDYLIT